MSEPNGTGQTCAAVIYAAKSTEDKHGSIPTQLADCRAMAAREGWTAVAEYEDENESAYHGSRGDGLARAKAHAEGLVAEGHSVVLIVQHSDRLARGDGGKQAAHLVEFSLWRKKSGVRIRSVQDDATWTTPMGHLIPALMGERNYEDSRRKGQSVKDGLERRRGRRRPVGSLPFGYAIEPELAADGKVIVDHKGKVINRRVVDPKTGPLRVELLERIAAGATPGSVARWLNAQGITTPRGKAFTEKTVTQIVESDVHAGGNSYPALVSAELAQAARDGLRRKDPAAIQRRKGGRRPNESYFLRGIAFCACGEPHYASDKWLGRSRGYVCRHRVKVTGLCDRPPIPAELLETHVLSHLDCFVDSAEEWIAGVLAERDGERKARASLLDQERVALSALDKQRDERMAELEAIGVTKIGMELIERIDAKRDAQQHRIAEAEAVLAEWAATPGVDEALDFYNGLLDMIRGRVRRAEGARELNEALASVLAGLWCEIRDGRLIVEFELREQQEVFEPDDPAFPPLAFFSGRTERDWLPPVPVGYQPVEPLSSIPGPPPYSS